jgi:hypothetical protein
VALGLSQGGGGGVLFWDHGSQLLLGVRCSGALIVADLLHPFSACAAAIDTSACVVMCNLLAAWVHVMCSSARLLLADGSEGSTVVRLILQGGRQV